MSASSPPILGHVTGGSSGELCLDFKPVDTSRTEYALRAAETACQLAIQHIPREVEASEALLRYPEDEADAVTITERDMEELQPGKFLGNNIVDFYIRYLERSLPPEHRERFYFFNSFFFTKLLESSAPTRIDPCKVDYEQLRRWTEKVNLFEKDYVFIPIVKSSHWSLIIICHLSSLTHTLDGMMRFPCIVHLDPIEGHHESFEGLIRSYVLQVWMEKFEPSIDKDQLLALYQMKYIQAKVPQQDNSQDCGLYVLNYIETFLIKSTLPNFVFSLSEIGVYFIGPHFVREVMAKRMHIQNLIQISQERTRKRTTLTNLIQELQQASRNLWSFLYDEGCSKDCMKDVQLVGSTISNGEDCEIVDASNHEDLMDVPHQQSILKSRENNKPLSGPQIELGFIEYQSRSESLPSKEYTEPKMQTIGPTNFKDLFFEAKHTSTHEDSHIQHQQSIKISSLDYEQLNGPKLQPVDHEKVIQSSLNNLHEIPCIDLSQSLKGKNKRGKNMTHEETTMLLLCKLEGGHFCKGSGSATHWNLISEEIEKELGSRPSANQCRLRFDTLLKAYKTYKKYCMKTSKTFSAITEEERLDLKVATTLREEWYTMIDSICNKAKPRKRMKINPIMRSDLYFLNSPHSPTSNPLPIPNGSLFEDEAAILDSVCGTSEVAIHTYFLSGSKALSSLNEDLQSTLVYLVEEYSWTHGQYNEKVLKKVCRRLAILQNREPKEILNYVFKLWELKLITVEDMDFKEGMDLIPLDIWGDKTWSLKFWVYEEISKEVLHKHSHLKTYYNSYPIEDSSLQYIKVLSLDECCELKHLDLKIFPNLQCLAIYRCQQLNSMTGWEVATNLGSIDICWCFSYLDFPNVQYLFSLREFTIDRWGCNKSIIPWQLSEFSQCVKLQRLEIWFDESLSKIADLKNLKDLKFLEFLSIGACTFSNIQGLSGLKALKILHLRVCKNLKRIPNLGCLKGLTELSMTDSGVEDVVGVEEMHLLTSLCLGGCKSLKWLPFLGNLKALVYLDLSETGVKEIPGREQLISLQNSPWDID